MSSALSVKKLLVAAAALAVTTAYAATCYTHCRQYCVPPSGWSGATTVCGSTTTYVSLVSNNSEIYRAVVAGASDPKYQRSLTSCSIWAGWYDPCGGGYVYNWFPVNYYDLNWNPCS